ncbi:MAG TPA: hypothetical protein VKZ97_10910 [Flavobacteriaceae bacterium]|nr:hypothetical protein [Flavobacteriaceae bacterium]
MTTTTIILLVAGIFSLVGLGLYIASRVFDDSDPDLYALDSYGEEHRPYIVNGNCTHPPLARFMHVVDSNVNCETTVIKCALCSETLTEPKSDCK